MTVVVADTSPLNYLILIEAIDLLLRLYERIIIPTGVLAELIDDSAPGPVKEWAMKLPQWVEVRSAPPTNDPSLAFLDQGERGAINLAQTEAEVLLLIDETAGNSSIPAADPEHWNRWRTSGCFDCSRRSTFCPRPVDRDQLSDFEAALGRAIAEYAARGSGAGQKLQAARCARRQRAWRAPPRKSSRTSEPMVTHLDLVPPALYTRPLQMQSGMASFVSGPWPYT